LEDTKSKDIASLNVKVEQQDQLILENENRHLRKVNSETNLKTQLDKANTDLALLQAVKRSQRCTLSSLLNVNTNLKAEITKLLKDSSTKNKEISSLNNKQDQLILEHDKAVSKLTDDNWHLKGLKINLKAEKSTLMAEKTKLLKDYSSLEDTKNEEIASLNDKVVQQDQLILEHDKAVSKLKFEKSTLVAEKTKLLKNYSSLEDTKSKDIASLNDKLEQQDLEHDKAVSQLEKADTILALALKDCEVKKAEIVKLKAEFVKVKANLDTIQIKVLKVKSESEIVQVDKHDKETVLDDLRKSFKALESELERVKKDQDSRKKAKDLSLKTEVRLVNKQTSMFLKAKAVEIEISKVGQCVQFFDFF
jgi:hypothetical protein